LEIFCGQISEILSGFWRYFEQASLRTEQMLGGQRDFLSAAEADWSEKSTKTATVSRVLPVIRSLRPGQYGNSQWKLVETLIKRQNLHFMSSQGSFVIWINNLF
jgi:hypothetical protein